MRFGSDGWLAHKLWWGDILWTLQIVRLWGYVVPSSPMTIARSVDIPLFSGLSLFFLFDQTKDL
jgi:hypothetical protein